MDITKSVREKNPSPRRKVWKIAWPTIAEQCLNLTVGLNEVFLIGHLAASVTQQLGYDSATALASTSLGQFFFWIAFAAFNGIGIATTALVARATGAKELQKATTYGRHGLLLNLGLGFLVAIALYTLGPLLLTLLGAEGQLLRVSVLFLETAAFGMPFFALLVSGNAALRGSGDTRTPLVIMLIVNATNIAVAWVFIHGNLGMPALGVQGAAFGAVASYGLGAILVLGRLFFGLPVGIKNRDFRLPRSFNFDTTFARTILGQGLPTAAEQWAFQIGIFFFARLLVAEGTTTYAAHNVVINIDSISFLPGIGMGIATTVLVGQALGAGKPDEAKLYAWTAMKMGVLFMTIMGASFVLFPEFFLRLLIADEAVIAEAAPALRIAGLFDPIIGFNFILMGALRGAGDTRFPLYARMLSSILVRVSLAYLFIGWLGWGLFGGRLAMGLDSVLLMALIAWRFQSGRWMTIFQERAALKSPPDIPAAVAVPADKVAATKTERIPAPSAATAAPDLE